jgi:hypothetical protein
MPVSELPDEQAGPTHDKPAWQKKRRGFRVCVTTQKEKPQISPLRCAVPSDPRKTQVADRGVLPSTPTRSRTTET